MATADQPETPEEPDYDASVRPARGSRVSFGLRDLPPFPPAILAIENDVLRQHAKDAWFAASCLDAGIWIWQMFLVATETGVSISDDNQRSIAAIFPEFGQMQMVLDHLAALPHEGQSAQQTGSGMRFPATEFVNLLVAREDLIRKHACALAAIGVHSPSFTADAPRVWEHQTSLLDGMADFTQNPPVIPLKRRVQPELLQLREEIIRFRGLLETAPATALQLPKHQLPPRPQGIDRLSVAVEKDRGTIKLDDTAYEVAPAAAVFVKALIAAKGLWCATNQLKKGEPELDGVRLDRLKFPVPIQNLIDAKPGAGYRLKVEALE